MADPFRSNTKSQLFREAQIGLTVVALLLALLVYVAFYRITGRGRHLPDHVRNAPVAKTVSPSGFPTQQMSSQGQRNFGGQASFNSNQSAFPGFQDGRSQFNRNPAAIQNSNARSTARSNGFANNNSGGGFSSNPKSESTVVSRPKHFAGVRSKIGSPPPRIAALNPKATGLTVSETHSVKPNSFTNKPAISGSHNSFAPTQKPRPFAPIKDSGFTLPKKIVQPQLNTEAKPPNNPFEDPKINTPLATQDEEDAGVQLASLQNDFNVQIREVDSDSDSKAAKVEAKSKLNPFSKPAVDDTLNSGTEATESKSFKDSKLKPLGYNGLRGGSSNASSFKVQVEPAEPVESVKALPKFNALPDAKPVSMTSPKPSFVPKSNSANVGGDLAGVSTFVRQASAVEDVKTSGGQFKPLNASAASSHRVVGNTVTDENKSNGFQGVRRSTFTTNVSGDSKVGDDPKPVAVFRAAPKSESLNGFAGSQEQAVKMPADRKPRSHTVKEGESFWSIAQTMYNDGRYFRALFRYNETLVSSFDDLPAGTVIQTPTLEELRNSYPDSFPAKQAERGSDSARERKYVTRRGDTLFEIARQQLGQASRFRDIYKLNETRLPSSQSHLAPLGEGVELILPAE